MLFQEAVNLVISSNSAIKNKAQEAADFQHSLKKDISRIQNMIKKAEHQQESATPFDLSGHEAGHQTSAQKYN
jgi:hypothetical protein